MFQIINFCSEVGGETFIYFNDFFNNKLTLIQLMYSYLGIRKIKPIFRPLIVRNFCTSEPNINPSKNYYKILNVSRSSDLPQIKRNFYEMAKKNHPDTNEGKQEEFKLINEAYNVLSNPTYRKKYDSMRPINENQEQEDYVEGYGPYQTKQDYTNHAKAAYYSHSKAEWARTRRGYRPQSNINYQSQKDFETGATSDQDIMSFQLKRRMREWKDQEDRNSHIQYFEKLKEKNEEFRRKHQELSLKVKREQEDRRKQYLRKSLVGRLFLKLQSIFGNKKNDLKDR